MKNISAEIKFRIFQLVCAIVTFAGIGLYQINHPDGSEIEINSSFGIKLLLVVWLLFFSYFLSSLFFSKEFIKDWEEGGWRKAILP